HGSAPGGRSGSGAGSQGRLERAATISSRDANPARRMDHAASPLSGLVETLAQSDGFRAFADAFPANARVSEPALPLLLATLHSDLGRPLVCLIAEDEEARDLAECIGWYVDPASVALLPSRGVHAGSRLQPPAPLV